MNYSFEDIKEIYDKYTIMDVEEKTVVFDRKKIVADFSEITRIQTEFAHLWFRATKDAKSSAELMYEEDYQNAFSNESKDVYESIILTSQYSLLGEGRPLSEDDLIAWVKSDTHNPDYACSIVSYIYDNDKNKRIMNRWVASSVEIPLFEETELINKSKIKRQ